jgi:hypothetical protein
VTHMKWCQTAHRRALLCCCTVKGSVTHPLRKGFTSAPIFRMYKQCNETERMHDGLMMGA